MGDRLRLESRRQPFTMKAGRKGSCGKTSTARWGSICTENDFKQSLYAVNVLSHRKPYVEKRGQQRKEDIFAVAPLMKAQPVPSLPSALEKATFRFDVTD